ncbi:nucleotide pyrophosphohydrolase [Amycolatopsis sp. NPDC058986]|uniref:nucleotide pyrophosphohydrolase n=1 Tax=unclassified Amycolatopsis TaxID=2618356 RepID=UPI00366A656F
MDLQDLRTALAEFVDQREWRQFHTPKNLAMALAGEAGELVTLFQWLTPEEAEAIMEDPQIATQVRHEIDDVLSYLIRLADVLDIDLAAALQDKIRLNEQHYPVHLARGTADKYDRLPVDGDC